MWEKILNALKQKNSLLLITITSDYTAWQDGFKKLNIPAFTI